MTKKTEIKLTSYEKSQTFCNLLRNLPVTFQYSYVRAKGVSEILLEWMQDQWMTFGVKFMDT
jgi:hypothetical protein